MRQIITPRSVIRFGTLTAQGRLGDWCPNRAEARVILVFPAVQIGRVHQADAARISATRLPRDQRRAATSLVIVSRGSVNHATQAKGAAGLAGTQAEGVP